MSRMRRVAALRREIRNWPAYLIRRHGYTVYKDRAGRVYELRNEREAYDKSQLSEIIVKKCYNPPQYDIAPGSVVVDVGANAGIFTIYAASTARIVYAFEPHPENYAMLCDNIVLNRLTNVYPLDQAVSTRCGRSKLYESHWNKGNHSLKREGRRGPEISVKTTTLDTLIAACDIERIGFLKMDCEGMELEILSGMKNIRRIDKMAIEYHSGIGSALKIWNLLEKEGFTGLMLQGMRGASTGLIHARRVP